MPTDYSSIYLFWGVFLHIFPPEDESKRDVSSSESCESTVGVQGSLFTQHLSNLKEVRRLDSLVRAHTLLAVMADKTSPEHQLNLLRAYTFVLRIWQVPEKGWGNFFFIYFFQMQVIFS